MKRTLLFFILMVPFQFSFSQENGRELPYSWEYDVRSTVETVRLPVLDLASVIAEDEINDRDKSQPWRYGITRPLTLDVLNTGTWTDLPNGARLWQIAINSPSAINISVNYDNFFLPEGARLHMYNIDRSDISKTYTKNENRENNLLGSWFIEGETIIIEYYEPDTVQEVVQLKIGSIIHGYRLGQLQDYINGEGRGLNDSGDCNYDVNCPIGSDFDEKKEILKKTVALLNLGNGYLCSASLINNTREDKTPYLLTANHCLEGSDPAFWSIRLNWTSPNPVCGTGDDSTDVETNFTMSGAILRASNSLSDFALVELSNSIPSSWDVAFAGWDRTDDLPLYEVGIHHPQGDIMKVSRDDSGAVHQNANGREVWLIGGVSVGSGNGWEIGTTESGSSGSPLFNQNGRIIGQLYAGQSYCEGNQNNNDFDIYGRFAVSWDSGDTPETRLMDWLDPLETGANLTDTLQNLLNVPDIETIGALDIYPNPAASFITIENFRYPDLSYSFYNVVGQRLMSGSISNSYNVLDIQSLSAGVYFLHIVDNESSQAITKKIIVER
ncbi:T9SS type A sorting domain-containing protein [Jejudonia soesokkakensis]|uniref:T9SS type A sorting domain-containing protein n=1 Tax=Jejudonia soesokkakensis TaxID=1323432 RepID=A0ABW2MRR2_9FLAO